MSAPDLAVLIPTYNRRPVLQLCLDALKMQTEKNFSVIIVNDGSTDDTADFLEAARTSSPFELSIFHQENSGPARARNLAVAKAVAPISLFLGDDILASPTLLERHLDLHRSKPAEHCCALGYTVWDTDHQSVTPFMRWFERYQFDYLSLLNGTPPSWKHAYTSNISFKTRLLRENRFDERFPEAAWEDIELAYRLQKSGQFSLTFLKDALATHVHPTSIKRALRRLETNGRMQHLFCELHPDAQFGEQHGLGARISDYVGRHEIALKAVSYLAMSLPSPGKVHSLALRAHAQAGYRRGHLS